MIETSVPKTDLRVIKTKKAIRDALTQLLAEKDISQITIKDIAETAVINRKTFYNYYRDIYDVIDEIENELIAVFEPMLDDIDFSQDRENTYRIFQHLTDIINSDLEFYSHLIKLDRNTNLIPKLISALKRKLKSTFPGQLSLNEQSLDTMVEYVISGMIAVYQNWFHSDHTQSLEEIARDVSALTFSSINGLIKEYS